ncbi:MAG: hypothetical protein AAGN66_24440 [Acidobacteriota bacterium]
MGAATLLWFCASTWILPPGGLGTTYGSEPEAVGAADADSVSGEDAAEGLLALRRGMLRDFEETLDPESALARVDHWLARHPGDPLARLWRVEALFVTGDARGTIAQCRSLGKEAAGVPGIELKVLGYEAASWLALGRYGEARDALRRLRDGVLTWTDDRWTAGWGSPGVTAAAEASVDVVYPPSRRAHLDALLGLLGEPDPESLAAGLLVLERSLPPGP